ncbi:transcription factor Adf-1-like [Dunckerocampus dactyliophorus]|uniref:transcription factor Adf-1-like n=1 Tax=Dunckerocampus dactyliophorus TaxID=161453 RepID=UPI0024065925|nr:transcription factor Adf-1-like [Dunckerocampus dactyliophorus]
MDDKLILGVFTYPELYNVTLNNYRHTESRTNAWRNISTSVGLPVDECKKKWKNLRDRYLKEVRLEMRNKKQGELGQSKWKYRQLMNFIAPFTGSRSSVADMCTDDDNGEHESGSMEDQTTPSEKAKTPPISKTAGGQADTKPLAGFVTQLLSPDTQTANMPQAPQTGKIGRKRRPVKDHPPSAASPTKWVVTESSHSFPSRPRDEDELFLLSFVPALKRLAPQKRCETKMKIQQIMYEAEFNVEQMECHEKHHLEAQD